MQILSVSRKLISSLTISPFPILTNRDYPKVYHATNKLAKTKGVPILLSKHLPIEISDSLTDEDGCYLFIKGSIWNRPITVANIYSPNTAQVSFFRGISMTLTSFQSGILILGGDFNVALNPFEDTSSGTSSLPYKALRQIKIQLQDL